MGAPYNSTSSSGYNANPPADDGSAVASNRVLWATIKNKLSDPLKTYSDTINSNISAAFGRVPGGAGVVSTSVDYPAGSADQGKLIKFTASGKTFTTPDATSVGSPFTVRVVNNSTGTNTIAGFGGTQTIDGVTSFSIPSGAGISLSTDGSNWFTEGQNFTRAFPLPGSFKNLSIKVASNTTVAVAADFVSTTDGATYQSTAVSSTVNLGTTGADALDTGTIAIDTWYAIWVIAKADGTTKCLASTSATAPTMPSGYTFKARIGWVRTIHGTATLYGTWQLGRRIQYVVGLAQTTVIPNIANDVAGTYSSTSPTLAAVSVAALVPTTAAEIIVNVTNNWTGATASNVIVAPSASYGGTNKGPAGTSGSTYPVWLNASVGLGVSVQFVLEAATIAWASSNSGAAINCAGWIDNI